MSIFPFAALMFAIPFGTSVQSIITAICVLYLLIAHRRDLRGFCARLPFADRRSQALLLAVILLQIIATWLNPKNPERDVVSFFIGFAPLVFVPSLFTLEGPIEEGGRAKLAKYWTVLMAFWGIIIFTQSIWGWKINGITPEVGTRFMRSQGFFSHPLTLAYVALMIWPLNMIAVCYEPKSWQRWLCVLANFALIYYSASRTAQAVALLATVIFFFVHFKGKTRWFVLLGMIASLSVVLTTENKISQRLKAMNAANLSEEKESNYADDRIAFAIVHWNMVKERPILGHGINIDRPYRVPYYEAIGLHDFKKAYEAHNQILQLAVEGGIFAALAFLGWMLSVHWVGANAPKPVRQIRDTTLLCLLVGGLTQNAYFDGEVRFALMTVFAFYYASGFWKRASL